METILNIWLSRDMSLMRRALLAKSLGVSKLVYAASMLTGPGEVINIVYGRSRPKSSHVQIFSKLLLQLDNEQRMSEKQKYWGAIVLVSEIKRIGNVVFLEASAFLLQGKKKLRGGL